MKSAVELSGHNSDPAYVTREGPVGVSALSQEPSTLYLLSLAGPHNSELIPVLGSGNSFSDSKGLKTARITQDTPGLMSRLFDWTLERPYASRCLFDLVYLI